MKTRERLHSHARRHRSKASGLSCKPLAFVDAGTEARVVKLAGGRRMQQLLVSMGLSYGAEIRVLRKGAPGPFVLGVGDTRLVVGAGMARKIIVGVKSVLP